MPRENKCMYRAHVCFYVCCNDYLGVCVKVCCVAAVVEDSGVLSLGVLKYVACYRRGGDGCCDRYRAFCPYL